MTQGPNTLVYVKQTKKHMQKIFSLKYQHDDTDAYHYHDGCVYAEVSHMYCRDLWTVHCQCTVLSRTEIWTTQRGGQKAGFSEQCP